jgi:hypothetical protein
MADASDFSNYKPGFFFGHHTDMAFVCVDA